MKTLDPTKWQKIESHPDFPLLSYDQWLAQNENSKKEYANYCRAYDAAVKLLQKMGKLA